MSDTLTLLSVLSLFQLIGGAVAGKGLRQGIRQGWSLIVLFSLFRGLGFGAMSFFIGLIAFLIMGAPYFILVEIFVFAAAILVVAFFPDSILESFNMQALAPILFGGILMAAGVVLFMTLSSDDLFQAFVALAVFEGFGGLVFVTSVLKALRG